MLKNKIVLIIIGIFIAFLFIELLLRFFPGLSYDAMISNSIENDGKCKRSKLYGFELIPNKNHGINSFGMKDKEYTMEKPDKVFRILVLGDSITEWGSWSEIVENKLNKIGNYEVLNCGVRSWGIKNYFNYFKFKGSKFNPDLVLVAFCLNDFSQAVYTLVNVNEHKSLLFYVKDKKNRDNVELTLKINPILFKKFYLYRFLVINLIKSNDQKRFQFDNPEVMLREIKKMANNHVAAIIFPYLKPISKYDEWERSEYTEIINTLNNIGIDYLDLTDYFNKYGEKIIQFRLKANDKFHFNDEANEMKAVLIYNWLVKIVNNN